MKNYFITCGAVIGDMAGVPYENKFIKQRPDTLFPQYTHFSDDTVMTCAIAQGLQEALKEVDRSALTLRSSDRDRLLENLTRTVRSFGKQYPHAGYGGNFKKWLNSADARPYGSYGNGAPMRCAYAGWEAQSLEEAELFGRLTAMITHDHPDAMTAAAIVAGCIFLLRQGAKKTDIAAYAGKVYDFNFTLNALRPIHSFNITASGTAPVSIKAFLESSDFADAIELAISMGGDTDTLAAITGSIAEAAYDIPENLIGEAHARLDRNLREAFLNIHANWENFTGRAR